MAAALALGSFAAAAEAQTTQGSEQKTGPVDRGVVRAAPEPPPGGILVTLAVFSGRPNPTWAVEPGAELDRLVAQIRSLKPTDATLFDYNEWNRLGYAGFWLSSRDLPGVAGRIHLWRDMAFIPSKEGKGLQATGASKLYEMLVTEAESKGYGEFFRNYRKQAPGKPTAR
jgi:hypothetical protein